MLMKSSRILNVTIGKPIILGNFTPLGNLNISNTFWPPFVDAYSHDKLIALSGPLVGLIVEVANLLKLSLTYRAPDNDSMAAHYKSLDSGATDVFVYPNPPMSLDEIQKFSLSNSLGFIKMICILSGAGPPKEPFFQFSSCFEVGSWIAIALSFIITAGMASYIQKSLFPYLYYYSIVMLQSPNFVRKNFSKEYIILLTSWLLSSTILVYAFTGGLLTYLFFAPSFDKIDSLEDLAKYSLNNRIKEFYVFLGEPCDEYVKQNSDPITEALRFKMKIIDISNDEKEKWEAETFPKLASAKYALVSDDAFLDYYWTTKLSKFPTLYRAENDFMPLPYFIPLSRHTSIELRNNFNKMVYRLFESGIYDQWISETLYMNNDAIRLGIVNTADDYSSKSLEMKHLHGLYFLWCLGIILSIISFCIEKLCCRLKANRAQFEETDESRPNKIDSNYSSINYKNLIFYREVSRCNKSINDLRTTHSYNSMRRNYLSNRYYYSF